MMWKLLYLKHEDRPTTLDRYIIEVANECNVKVERCNTSWAEMIAVHIAVADALHNASSGGPQK